MVCTRTEGMRVEALWRTVPHVVVAVAADLWNE